jgi:hypothetical protein
VARLDGLIIKYGDPEFERSIAGAGMPWATERFVYARQAEREGHMLADAVDARAAFAVANCEPNDGGGWDGSADAANAMRALVAAFRLRRPAAEPWICADLRRGRSLDAPFVHAAAAAGVAGWMPMVYPRAFGQSVAAAFDAAYPGATYLGLPCAPVIQTYDRIGPAAVQAQVAEAQRRGATMLSCYVVETATDMELAGLVRAKEGELFSVDPRVLRDTALAYVRGAVAILDHGTPSELRAWAELFGGSDHRGAVDAEILH